VFGEGLGTNARFVFSLYVLQTTFVGNVLLAMAQTYIACVKIAFLRNHDFVDQF
jgi:hypothetical protein